MYRRFGTLRAAHFTQPVSSALCGKNNWCLEARRPVKERLESACKWHKLGFVVSATALVLLFAPFKTDFRQALNEAYILRDLRADDYERWARGFLGINTLLPQLAEVPWGDWQQNITLFLSSKLDFAVEGRPDWDVTAIVEYERAPTNGSLANWLAWVSSSKPASYYQPDWSTARLSASRDGVGITKPPLVRHFLLRASEWRRFDGEYSFRAYVEQDQGQAPVANWWKPIDNLDSRDVFGRHQELGLDDSRFLVEGDLSSQPTLIADKTGIRQWLEAAGIWAKITTNDGAGEVVLPGMQRNWSDLRERSLGDAISFMEAKQREIQDVSLLGLPVPGQLCIVAIPLAYLVILLFLLLDVRSILMSPSANKDPLATGVAWFAVYDDGVARWITAASLTLIPVALSVALLLKYYSRVPAYSVTIAVVSSVVSLVLGIAAYRAVSAVRAACNRGDAA